MRKVAILGAYSFLARNLQKYINIRYSDVIQTDLYDIKQDDGLFGARYRQIDFDKDNELQRIIFDVDAVIVYLGLTGQKKSLDKYSEFINVNEILLLRLLNECKRQGASPRIIYPSSRLIYKENTNQSITEGAAKELNSVYAITKYSAEQYLRLYYRLYGLDYVILRMCTPIGSLVSSDGSYGTFKIFRKQALEKGKITVYGDGNIKKTFTAIEDICEAFVRIIISEEIQYKEYNLGGETLLLRDIAGKIAEKFSVPVEYVPWPSVDEKLDGGSVVFNSSRFDSEFDFKYSHIKV